MIPLRLEDASKQPSNRKYRNHMVVAAHGVEGFDSKHEQKVYGDLLWEQLLPPAKGSVKILVVKRQVKYQLIPRQSVGGKIVERAVHYLADFCVHRADGSISVIDAKSEITRKNPAYVIKRKLMLHVHGIQVIEK